MRTIAEIEADLQDIKIFDEAILVTFRGQKTDLAIIRLLRDIPDLLARIAELEAQNARLLVNVAEQWKVLPRAEAEIAAAEKEE